jgi:hypothetical protein
MSNTENKANNICANCDKKFKSIQGLISHAKRKIPCTIKLRCPQCNKEFKTNWNLEQHKNRKTPCVKQSKIDNEKELLLFKHNLDLEKIAAQKEKDLAVEEKNWNAKNILLALPS